MDLISNQKNKNLENLHPIFKPLLNSYVERISTLKEGEKLDVLPKFKKNENYNDKDDLINKIFEDINNFIFNNMFIKYYLDSSLPLIIINHIESKNLKNFNDSYLPPLKKLINKSYLEHKTYNEMIKDFQNDTEKQNEIKNILLNMFSNSMEKILNNDEKQQKLNKSSTSSSIKKTHTYYSNNQKNTSFPKKQKSTFSSIEQTNISNSIDIKLEKLISTKIPIFFYDLFLLNDSYYDLLDSDYDLLNFNSDFDLFDPSNDIPHCKIARILSYYKSINGLFNKFFVDEIFSKVVYSNLKCFPPYDEIIKNNLELQVKSVVNTETNIFIYCTNISGPVVGNTTLTIEKTNEKITIPKYFYVVDENKTNMNNTVKHILYTDYISNEKDYFLIGLPLSQEYKNIKAQDKLEGTVKKDEDFQMYLKDIFLLYRRKENISNSKNYNIYNFINDLRKYFFDSDVQIQEFSEFKKNLQLPENYNEELIYKTLDSFQKLHYPNENKYIKYFIIGHIQEIFNDFHYDYKEYKINFDILYDTKNDGYEDSLYVRLKSYYEICEFLLDPGHRRINDSLDISNELTILQNFYNNNCILQLVPVHLYKYKAIDFHHFLNTYDRNIYLERTSKRYILNISDDILLQSEKNNYLYNIVFLLGTDSEISYFLNFNKKISELYELDIKKNLKFRQLEERLNKLKENSNKNTDTKEILDVSKYDNTYRFLNDMFHLIRNSVNIIETHNRIYFANILISFNTTNTTTYISGKLEKGRLMNQQELYSKDKKKYQIRDIYYSKYMMTESSDPSTKNELKKHILPLNEQILAPPQEIFFKLEEFQKNSKPEDLTKVQQQQQQQEQQQRKQRKQRKNIKSEDFLFYTDNVFLTKVQQQQQLKQRKKQKQYSSSSTIMTTPTHTTLDRFITSEQENSSSYFNRFKEILSINYDILKDIKLRDIFMYLVFFRKYKGSHLSDNIKTFKYIYNLLIYYKIDYEYSSNKNYEKSISEFFTNNININKFFFRIFFYFIASYFNTNVYNHVFTTLLITKNYESDPKFDLILFNQFKDIIENNHKSMMEQLEEYSNEEINELKNSKFIHPNIIEMFDKIIKKRKNKYKKKKEKEKKKSKISLIFSNSGKHQNKTNSLTSNKTKNSSNSSQNKNKNQVKQRVNFSTYSNKNDKSKQPVKSSNSSLSYTGNLNVTNNKNTKSSTSSQKKKQANQLLNSSTSSQKKKQANQLLKSSTSSLKDHSNNQGNENQKIRKKDIKFLKDEIMTLQELSRYEKKYNQNNEVKNLIRDVRNYFKVKRQLQKIVPNNLNVNDYYQAIKFDSSRKGSKRLFKRKYLNEKEALYKIHDRNIEARKEQVEKIFTLNGVNEENEVNEVNKVNTIKILPLRTNFSRHLGGSEPMRQMILTIFLEISYINGFFSRRTGINEFKLVIKGKRSLQYYYPHEYISTTDVDTILIGGNQTDREDKVQNFIFPRIKEVLERTYSEIYGLTFFEGESEDGSTRKIYFRKEDTDTTKDDILTTSVSTKSQVNSERKIGTSIFECYCNYDAETWNKINTFYENLTEVESKDFNILLYFQNKDKLKEEYNYYVEYYNTPKNEKNNYLKGKMEATLNNIKQWQHNSGKNNSLDLLEKSKK